MLQRSVSRSTYGLLRGLAPAAGSSAAADPKASRRPRIPNANITGRAALPREVTCKINQASGITRASRSAGSREEPRTSRVMPSTVDPTMVNSSAGMLTIQPTSNITL